VLPKLPSLPCALLLACAGLRRKGAVVADHELERIMAQVDLDGNHTLDFQVGSNNNHT
jgi:hypothetical protein